MITKVLFNKEIWDQVVYIRCTPSQTNAGYAQVKTNCFLEITYTYTSHVNIKSCNVS